MNHSKASRLKLTGQDSDALITAIHSQDSVKGLTHDFYKYPARFSPQFARAAIDIFTEPGDLVADPFVGGGTTLVEARASGRLGIGSDISSLSTFVCKTKTSTMSRADIHRLEKWFEKLPERLNLYQETKPYNPWRQSGYFRNLDCRHTWPIRKSLELAIANVRFIKDAKRRNFARCVLLRTAQWALDGRREFPTAKQFRERIVLTAKSMLAGAQSYTRIVKAADKLAPAGGKRRTTCLHTEADGLSDYLNRSGRSAPKLLVTSPPYPGVHIIYHRWQVHGGRETPAPFWIADKLDGAGESYYLMYARSSALDKYYRGISSAFSAVRRVVAEDATIIQLLAFSDPDSQLSCYLDVMERCGFREYLLSDYIDSQDGRIWRNVPGRKWHANSKGKLASGKEVVLIHKPS